MDHEDDILRCLARIGPAKAGEIARQTGLENRKAANSVLYRLLNAGKAVIDEEYRWSLPRARRTAAINRSAAATAVNRERAVVATGRTLGNAGESLPKQVMTSGQRSPRSEYPNADAVRTAASPAQIKWTEEQGAIINGPFDDRVLVEAGPGTGKTAVACARVAKLLGQDDVTPSAILMVSFTRTAVAEMKSRIRLWADSGRVDLVNVCTLDQAAFQFGIGCGEKFQKLMGNFDNNIQAAVEHFTKRDPLLLEYVRGLQHVVIDEAQDLIGARAELAALLLQNLRREAGATVFADPAQAIFGFTTDVDGSQKAARHFLQTFDSKAAGFKPAQLTKIHRSSNPAILDLFTDSRYVLNEPQTKYGAHVKNVISVAQRAAPCEGDDVQKFQLQDGDLLLYRKRASALMHATWCPKLFRLRLPAHPPAIFPWIGLVFSRYTEPLVSQAQFVAAWSSLVPAEMRDGFTAETAWALLCRFAADRSDVSLTRLRAKLSLPRPPVEFCQLDYGGTGPIFSTIHASKGREADRVLLMLPRNLDYLQENDGIDPEEEARVYYVGSTRVRKQFLRGIAQTLRKTRRLDDGSERVVQLCADDKLKFQVGLACDFDELAAISRESFFCPSSAAATANQTRILEVWRRCLAEGSAADIKSVVKAPPDGSIWPYKFVENGNDQTLAWSSSVLGHDLWMMCNQVEKKFGGQRRPPSAIPHLRMIGLRTRVLGDDPASLGRIHKPFALSGFWLVPMIVGFQPVYFPLRNRR